MLIAIFNLSGCVGTPYLLGYRFGQDTKLAFALLDLKVGVLELGSSFSDLQLELIAGQARGVFCSLSSRTDDRDRNGAKNKRGEKSPELFCDRNGIQRRDEKEIDDERGQDNGDKSGDGAPEPCAAHDGAEKQKQKRIGDNPLKGERPEQRDQHKTDGNRTGPKCVGHRPAGESYRACHVGIITGFDGRPLLFNSN